MRDPFSGGVSTVGTAKGIIDVDLALLTQLGGKGQVVGRLGGMETGILKQNDLAWPYCQVERFFPSLASRSAMAIRRLLSSNCSLPARVSSPKAG